MVSLWRITKQKHIDSAFTGEGARLFGGRWNSPGTAVIYAAQSQALAVLEMLVHLNTEDLLKAYVLMEATLDESLIAALDSAALPKNWRDDLPSRETQGIGDAWVASARSLALRVPSVIVPAESNFLLNPQHPEFRKLHIGEPAQFQFSPRLLGRR